MNKLQKILIAVVILITGILLVSIGRYWYADLLYAKGDAVSLAKAVRLSSKEAVFHNQLANSYADLAVALKNNKDSEKADQFASLAIAESNRAQQLSPANLNILRSRAALLIKLSSLDLKFLGSAKDALLTAANLAPTDAKIFYNLALIYFKTGEPQTGLQLLQKTIELKPNYKEARYYLALTLAEAKQYDEAKKQLNYILEKIDPNDTSSQKQLEKLK